MSRHPDQESNSDELTTPQPTLHGSHYILPCSSPPTSPPTEEGPTTTVMIYLAGDNNLSEECIYALTELKKARPGGLVRVIAQYDPADEFLPTQRYEIKFDSTTHCPVPLAYDFIGKYPFDKKESHNAFYIRPPYGERRERKGEGGTGDPRMLYNFIAFCVDQYPKTDHYVLIICGHGAGINRDFLLTDNRPDGYLTIAELRRALRWMKERLKGKNNESLVLDMFGMDVCLMSMAEVTYELRGLAKIVIGCESYSPAAGWPYRQTVEAIHFEAAEAGRQKELSINEEAWKHISEKIVKEYVRFYSDYWLSGLSVSMSAIRLSKIEDLVTRLRELSDLMILELKAEDCEHEENYDADDHNQENQQQPDTAQAEHRQRRRGLSFKDALVLAHWRAQSYNGELYVDLADFCYCLAEYAPRYIAAAARRVADFITKDLIIISCTWGRLYQYSYGISIYFPWDSLVPYYGASIYFPSNSKWVEFLKKYVQATRRGPRRPSPPCKPPCNHKLERILIKRNNEGIRMGSDKMGSDKMGSDKGGNPIHSMRNPPIVFIPDCCLDEAKYGNVRCVNAKLQKILMHDVEEHYSQRATTETEGREVDERRLDREMNNPDEG